MSAVNKYTILAAVLMAIALAAPAQPSFNSGTKSA